MIALVHVSLEYETFTVPASMCIHVRVSINLR